MLDSVFIARRPEHIDEDLAVLLLSRANLMFAITSMTRLTRDDKILIALVFYFVSSDFIVE